MKGLTFSGMERAMRCAAAVVLPHSDAVSEESTAGDVRHAYLRNVAHYGQVVALEMAPEDARAELARIDLDAIPPLKEPGKFWFEAAFAFHVDTAEARFLGTDLNRRYEVSDREIAGTLDVVGGVDDAILVADWKSGWGQNVPSAEANWQLAIGALAAARHFNKDRATVAAVLLKDGNPYWDAAEISVMGLDVIEDSVRSLVRRIDELRKLDLGVEHTKQGPWCRYCPALPSCPAKKALLSAALDKELVPGGALNAENARQVYERLVAIDLVRDLMWKTLDEFASIEPIDLGDGYVYGQRQKERTSIANVKAALSVLQREHGLDVSDRVELSLTNEAVKDAIRAKHAREGVKRQLTKAYDAAVAALVEAGAARTSTFNVTDRHRRPKELPESTTNPTQEMTADAAHHQE